MLVEILCRFLKHFLEFWGGAQPMEVERDLTYGGGEGHNLG